MNDGQDLHGVWAAAATPLDGNGKADVRRFVALAARLVAGGCRGVAAFGTTGEGQFFAVDERRELVEEAISAGLAPSRIIVGSGALALSDAASLTRHAAEMGCAAALVLPPFLFDKLDDDGLYAFYARLIERVGAARPRILLYNIPGITRQALSPTLLARLAGDFPGVVIGVKDSSGDWASTTAYLARCPRQAVFVGHEAHLARALRAGGAGTICGLANVMPLTMARIAKTRDEALAASLVPLIDRVCALPFVPTLKSVLAIQTGDAGWSAVRPPLSSLGAELGRPLARDIAGFEAAGEPAEARA